MWNAPKIPTHPVSRPVLKAISCSFVLSASFAIEWIVTYTECGMYLIAACMPTLRVLFPSLQDAIKSLIQSFFQKTKVTRDTNKNDQAHSDKIPLDARENLVDIKLTGLGKLETLLRKGNKVCMSCNDSIVGGEEAYIRPQPNASPVEVCLDVFSVVIRGAC